MFVQPLDQTCTVANGSGTVGSTDVTNVAVTCIANTATVGGTVSGLIGTVVLQDNGGDSLTISANGGFTFATLVATGSPYSVTVLTQPTRQTCTVANGAGTMAGTNITNVTVSCAITQPSMITVSISPKRGGLTTSQTQVFTATVVNDLQNVGVTWSVDGNAGGSAGVGTISTNGLYTPGTQAGAHSVTATSKADATATASSNIAVTDLAGVFTYHNDNTRQGVNTQEYALTPSTLSSSTFGMLFSCALDLPGYVYAQPLYAANLTMNDGKKHNVVFVATESDWVYAFDADSGSCQPLWKKRVLAAGETTVPPADTGEVSDLVPEIGVTSTPVIDPSTSTIYVCAKAKDAGAHYHHRLYALNLTDGTPKFGSPVEITAPNFNILFHLQRPALLLNNGVVYIAFGSHGDNNIYQGWLFAYDAATLAQKFAFATTDPTSAGPAGHGNQGSIWQSGNGPAVDAGGNIYVETANGVFDPLTNNFSDSVLKISPTGSVLDYFTPFNQTTLNANDVDLGSSGVVILPDAAGSSAHPHLAIATGKTGFLYLLDQSNLGKFNSVSNQDVQEVPVQSNSTQIVGGIFGQPAFWNGNAYVAAVGDFLKQFTVANGSLSPGPVHQSSNTFDLRGMTPAVSANGATAGIVWALDISAYPTGPAVLYAYDAANVSNLLFTSPGSGAGAAGAAVKFTVPTVANGKVYVGGQGSLTVFGLKPN